MRRPPNEEAPTRWLRKRPARAWRAGRTQPGAIEFEPNGGCRAPRPPRRPGARDLLDHPKRGGRARRASRGKWPQATRRTGKPVTTASRPGGEGQSDGGQVSGPTPRMGTHAPRPRASLSGCHSEESSPRRAPEGDCVQEGCREGEGPTPTDDGRASQLAGYLAGVNESLSGCPVAGGTHPSRTVSTLDTEEAQKARKTPHDKTDARREGAGR